MLNNNRQPDFDSIRGRVKPGVSVDMICSAMLDHLITGIALYELRGDKVGAIYLSKGYYGVVGYTKEQYEQYIDDVTASLYPEYIEQITLAAKKSLETGEIVYIECRGRKADGSNVWILVKARAVDFIESEYPVFLALVQDITKRKQQSVEDAINLERYYMLEETSNTIVFEYDIAEDVMTFMYRSKSGQEREKREIKDYLETSKRTVIVHPDDNEVFFSSLLAACKAPTRGMIDYRTTVLDQSTYRWARTTYSSVADYTGKVVKLLGRIQDIEEERREKERMVQLIETDSTTGLYNKLTATNHIQQLLDEKTSKKSFFAIMDIDDFKNFNDTYGHSFGDEVLAAVGKQLKQTFPDYVIGRFGGDEFILFGRNSSEAAVFDAFEKYLSEVSKIRLRDIDCNIRCSVGISWSENNDKTYSMYFDSADNQLYKSKKSGKNRISNEKLS